MNRKWKFTSLFIGIAACLIAVCAAASPSPACPRYEYVVEDLGVLGKGNNSTATDMNGVGWVAGSSNLNADSLFPQHAFLWYGAGPLRDLGTLGGPTSEAGGPNIYGEAAVVSETAKKDSADQNFCQFVEGNHYQCLGAISRHGKLIPLPTLPGGNNAAAYGINNLGEVAGFADTSVSDSTCITLDQKNRFEAVKWDADGRIHLLHPLAGDTVGFAFGLNDLGQVVGTSGTCATVALPPLAPAGLHAVLWERDGTPVRLGPVNSIANSVNDLSQVNGVVVFPSENKARTWIWTKEQHLRYIDDLPGADLTIAGCCRTLNNRGEIAGFSVNFASGTSTAFVWKDGHTRDLNTLIAPGSHLRLQGAYSINDAGEIAAQACVLDKPKSPGAAPVCTTEFHAVRVVPAK